MVITFVRKRAVIDWELLITAERPRRRSGSLRLPAPRPPWNRTVPRCRQAWTRVRECIERARSDIADRRSKSRRRVSRRVCNVIRYRSGCRPPRLRRASSALPCWRPPRAPRACRQRSGMRTRQSVCTVIRKLHSWLDIVACVPSRLPHETAAGSVSQRHSRSLPPAKSGPTSRSRRVHRRPTASTTEKGLPSQRRLGPRPHGPPPRPPGCPVCDATNPKGVKREWTPEDAAPPAISGKAPGQVSAPAEPLVHGARLELAHGAKARWPPRSRHPVPLPAFLHAWRYLACSVQRCPEHAARLTPRVAR